ncbi:MAG: hypothetical protein ABSC05_35940 [Candidatus Solibacter sp.]|jgi:hypothetical protein
MTYETLLQAPLSANCDARLIVTRRPLTAEEWDKLTAYLAEIRTANTQQPEPPA